MIRKPKRIGLEKNLDPISSLVPRILWLLVHLFDQFPPRFYFYFFSFSFSFLFLLHLWFPKWLRSGVAAPRPRRIRRLESLHRWESEAELQLRPHRGLQRAAASRGWCGWRQSSCCCWDFSSLRYTSRCCGATRCLKEMLLWAWIRIQHLRRWVRKSAATKEKLNVM